MLNEMKIRDILYMFCLAALLLPASCSSRHGLERMAMERMPKGLEKAMEEQMSLKGGAKIESPETIYDCDSLCIIQFKAVAKDTSGEEFSFPVRYIFLRDVFMSAAKGHPVYSEMVVGSPTMDRKEVEMLKESCRKTGHDLYIFYSGAANPIDQEDIW